MSNTTRWSLRCLWQEGLQRSADPLSPGAILEKAGKPVDLGTFGVGDRVIVKWQVTDKGHTILALKAK